jgi:hypothetical protein
MMILALVIMMEERHGFAQQKHSIASAQKHSAPINAAPGDTDIPVRARNR